jgi:uncharacterized coiled-coil DUF342 family protein
MAATIALEDVRDRCPTISDDSQPSKKERHTVTPEQIYRDPIEAQLKELDARIDLLTARADKVRAEARVAYHEQLRELRDRREDIRAQLQALQETGDRATEDVRTGIGEAMRDLRDAVDKAISRFE